MIHIGLGYRESVLVGVLALVLTWPPAAFGEPVSALELGRFSSEKVSHVLPVGWEPFYFQEIRRHTDYRLVEEDGQVVVQAVAEGSASGLIRKINVDLKKHPVLQWRWKIANVLKEADIYRKKGDDCVARIAVIFKYDSSKLSASEKIKYEIGKMIYGEYPPLVTINYVWASKAKVGSIVPSAYTDRSLIIVIESGGKNVNQWLTEERNVYKDYQAAFDDEPPLVSGVAIMTDTDDTGESTTAYYGDILLRKAEP
jgi:hypothetical protein